MRNIVIFSGSSHLNLSRTICERLGLTLGQANLTKFSNGEINAEIQESVRGLDTYIIQSSSGDINDNFMELLIMIHACKIASASKVTAVIPFFFYAKQPVISHEYQSSNGYDNLVARSGTLVANMLTEAGADHIITLDLHDPQYQGFFDIPVDNIFSRPLIMRYIKENIPNFREAVVVSPDAGGAKRATEIAHGLGLEFALIHRDRARKVCDESIIEIDNITNPMILAGDVSNMDVIIIDDMADTCFTLVTAASLLKENGARKIYAIVTHARLSEISLKMITDSEIDEIIVSNSIPQADNERLCSKLKVFDLVPILSEAIRRTHNGESVSFLFDLVPI